MGRSHGTALGVSDDHRRTIGGKNCQYPAPFQSDGRIGLRLRASSELGLCAEVLRSVGADFNYARAMHLAQPERLPRQNGSKKAAILPHCLLVVSRPKPEIHRPPWPGAHSAIACGAAVAHAMPGRAADRNQVGFALFHSICSRTDVKSPGSATSKETMPLPEGSSNESARACSIWRWAPATARPPYSVSPTSG